MMWPVIQASMLTSLEAQLLRTLLEREQVQAAIPEPLKYINAGDLVQLHPYAHQTFGGMLAFVTQIHPLRGYLLRPHRGGCREAWIGFHACDVERIGAAYWPDVVAFSRRCEWWRPECEGFHAYP